tara:strand:+ start:1225 stop:2088 length:864 start_codon:yes stop_codon:yes gene_type:complete
MSDLILCILSTGGIFLSFRYFKNFGVNTPMAIVINYFVATCLGWSLAGGVPAIYEAVEAPWFSTTVIMGAGFLFLFNMIAYCTRELGVAVASISTKLSLIIPATVFILIDPSDNLSIEKICAFILAIVAIFLSSIGTSNSKVVDQTRSSLLLAVPAIIFLGSGGIDLVFGLNSDANPLIFTSVPFTVAFIMGLLARIIPKHRYPISTKDLIGGIVLGVTNFGSLYYLLGAYENSGLDKSAVIPSLNIGVIIFSTLVAVALFKEKPSTKTSWGLVLGLISISVFLFSV